jgi:hypothetical protein
MVKAGSKDTDMFLEHLPQFAHIVEEAKQVSAVVFLFKTKRREQPAQSALEAGRMLH